MSADSIDQRSRVTRKPVPFSASKTLEWVLATLLAAGLVRLASAEEFISAVRELPILKDWAVATDLAQPEWNRILPATAVLVCCLSATWHAKRRPGDPPLGRGWWGIQMFAGGTAFLLSPTAAVLATMAGFGLGLMLHQGYRPSGAVHAIFEYLMPLTASIAAAYWIAAPSVFSS